MNNYPEVVAKIASDYLERVKSQLRLVPTREQNEFLREIESHLYEAYRQTPGDDDVARILAVLRNLGEPAEVVSDRLARCDGAFRQRSATCHYMSWAGYSSRCSGSPGIWGFGVLLGLLPRWRDGAGFLCDCGKHPSGRRAVTCWV